MSKRSAFFLCVLYALIIPVVSVLIFALPREAFSPEENRMLAELPSVGLNSLLDGSFGEELSAFCCDRFPLRTQLLHTDTRLSEGLGRLESGGVMRGKNGNLIKRLELYDAETLVENLNAVKRICAYAKSMDTKAVFFCAPRAIDVLSGFSPLEFDPHAGGLWDKINQYGALTATDTLHKKAESGEYIFYRTDHHWTSLGAYYAYAELGKHLGYSPFPLTDFTEEQVCGDFLGSSYSASLFPSVNPDAITAFRFESDGEIKITDQNTGEVFGLYDENSLSSASKYDFFLGGNKAHLKIESGKKRRLVIVKDSFANSLVPFLSRHFDLEIIDPRYLRRPLSELLDSIYANGDAPALLLLFNPETLCTDAGIDNFG